MDKDRAYKLVQELAFRASAKGLSFPELVRASPEVRRRLRGRVLDRALDLKMLLRHIDAVYRRVGLCSGVRRPASRVRRKA
jgi:adenylosuccinate lyase